MAFPSERCAKVVSVHFFCLPQAAPPFPEIKSSHSLVAKHLTQDKWERLARVATSTTGFTLDKVNKEATNFDHALLDISNILYYSILYSYGMFHFDEASRFLSRPLRVLLSLTTIGVASTLVMLTPMRYSGMSLSPSSRMSMTHLENSSTHLTWTPTRSGEALTPVPQSDPPGSVLGAT